MKKKFLMMILTIMSAMILVSCGSKMPKELKTEDITENTLYIKADGSNQIAYTSDFREKYYNLDELKSFIFAELKEYNDKYGEETASLTDISEKDGKVKTVIIFKDSKAFLDFNKKKGDISLSFPSFSKIEKDFSSVDFISADGGESKKGKEAVDSDKDNAVLITGPILLKTEKKIKFYSTGKLIDKHNISLGEGEEALVVFAR